MSNFGSLLSSPWHAHTTLIDSVLEDEELLPGFDGGGGTRVHALDLMEMDYDL